jgi:hypothetical protein
LRDRDEAFYRERRSRPLHEVQFADEIRLIGDRTADGFGCRNERHLAQDTKMARGPRCCANAGEIGCQ